MTIEKPLLDGSATDFESALLRSAAEEAPSAELSAKMMSPLALSGAAAMSSEAGKMTALKWGALTLAVGVAATAVMLGGSSANPPGSGNVPRAPVSAPRSDERGPDELASAPEGMKNAPTKTAVSSTLGDSKFKATPNGPVITKKAEASSLADEMRLLDQARTALANKDPKSALRALASYDQKYPRGTLREEATVLRVSALKEDGRAAEAKRLKDQFLKTHPESAHKTRLDTEESRP